MAAFKALCMINANVASNVFTGTVGLMLDKGNDDVASKYLTFIQPAGAQKLNSSIPTDFTYSIKGVSINYGRGGTNKSMGGSLNSSTLLWHDHLYLLCIT